MIKAAASFKRCGGFFNISDTRKIYRILIIITVDGLTIILYNIKL